MIRLPRALKNEMLSTMAVEGWSSKKQSRWIEEALHAMARHDPDMSESLIGDRAQGPNDKTMTISLTREGHDQLKDLIIRLRLQVPMIDGVQSVVLRSAIRFRLRNPDCFLKSD